MFDVVDILILGVGMGGIFTLIIAFLNRRIFTRKVDEFKTMMIVGSALILCSFLSIVFIKTADKIIGFIEALL